MSFDANDTVHVSNGIPPYTYSATLNSFSHSGRSYTYTASKPSLDTITVTDSHGNTANAHVTVRLVDFGGMYGYSWARNYPNPLMGLFNCPAGYISRAVLGTNNVFITVIGCTQTAFQLIMILREFIVDLVQA